jgi:hypothetical protein
MASFTAGRLWPASNDGSARAEALKGDKSPTKHQIPNMEARVMKRTALRAEPISTHLERHRDCLNRCRTERGLAAAAEGDRGDEWELAPLPFQRRNDED